MSPHRDGHRSRHGRGPPRACRRRSWRGAPDLRRTAAEVALAAYAQAFTSTCTRRGRRAPFRSMSRPSPRSKTSTSRCPLPSAQRRGFRRRDVARLRRRPTAVPRGQLFKGVKVPDLHFGGRLATCTASRGRICSRRWRPLGSKDRVPQATTSSPCWSIRKRRRGGEVAAGGDHPRGIRRLRAKLRAEYARQPRTEAGRIHDARASAGAAGRASGNAHCRELLANVAAMRWHRRDRTTAASSWRAAVSTRYVPRPSPRGVRAGRRRGGRPDGWRWRKSRRPTSDPRAAAGRGPHPGARLRGNRKPGHAGAQAQPYGYRRGRGTVCWWSPRG